MTVRARGSSVTNRTAYFRGSTRRQEMVQEKLNKVAHHQHVVHELSRIGIAYPPLCEHEIGYLLKDIGMVIVPGKHAGTVHQTLVTATGALKAIYPQLALVAQALAVELRADQNCDNCGKWFDYGKECPNCNTQVGVPDSPNGETPCAVDFAPCGVHSAAPGLAPRDCPNGESCGDFA